MDTDMPEKPEESARPWTPSYSVHSQGSSPHLANSELPEENGASELEPPRSWTPSYSVHSQGSPLLASSDPPREDIPPLDETILQPESQSPPDLVISPPAEQDDTNGVPDITSESDPVPLSDVSAGLAEIGNSAPLRNDTQDEPAKPMGVEFSPPAELTAENHEPPELMAGVVKSQPQVWDPEAVAPPSPATGSTSEGVHSQPPLDLANSQGDVPEESLAGPPLERSNSLTWVPSYSVNSQGSPLQPEANLPALDEPAPSESVAAASLERSNSLTWVPSYSVDNQGSPLQAAANLPVLNEPASLEPATDVPSDESNSPTWVPSYSVKSQGSPLQPTTDLQALNEPAPSEPAADQPVEESNPSSWVPSYSVKSQGSPLPTETPIPDEPVLPESTSASIERSNSPTWVPSYSVNNQGSLPQPEEPALKNRQ
ncbi:hypothetical protein BD779DRAFT_574097 [Infundibulicybe gibba]|nr:hypothetical protein BD779DRAFT_574097 [Infundibulicybe gibba]